MMDEAMEVCDASAEYAPQVDSPAVPEGYRGTEIGIIPEDWEVSAVRQKGEVLAGKALAVNAPGEQRPYLRTKNVLDGRIDIADVLKMPMTDEQFRQFQIRNGDVLLNEGQSLELVGRCAIYKDEYPEPCAIQNALLRFRARPGVCENFASHLFRHCQQNGVFSRISLQTTSVAHLGSTRFGLLRLAWPKEVEQRAIATALGDADELLETLDRLIAKKRDIKQAALQQLLTGETRLPGFDEDWETARFCELALPSNIRIDPSRSAQSEFCVELEHIEQQTGRLIGCTSTSPNSSLKAVFEAGDVLFGKLRAYLRKYWLADRGGVCSTEIWVLKPSVKKISAGYLYQLVRTDWFVEAASTAYGTHMPRSDWKVVRELELSIPGLAEQEGISQVLGDMDDELDVLEHRRAKTAALKQAMMQELLTGRTRLV